MRTSLEFPMRRLFALLLPLAACAPEAETSDPNRSGEEAPEVSWYADIEPLVQRSCASCHDTEGVGGLVLTDAAVAQDRAAEMAFQVSARVMPPPSMDPDCRSYAGQERMNLSDEERALFQAWADDGAPLGDPSTAPEPVDWAVRMDEADIILPMPFEHTLELDGDGNEYFCMIVENPLEDTVWITDIDVDVGNPSVVHHMLLIEDTSGDAGAGYGVDDPSGGFHCRDPIMESDWSAYHAWAPGMDMTSLPEGMGMKLEAGAQLVVQMHYYDPDPTEDHTDLSSYKLKVTTERPETEVQFAAVGPWGFTIPAGEQAHTEHEQERNTWLPITLYGVFPHMHLLGTAYKAWIEDDQGETTCVAEGDYSFDHQAFYIYDTPIVWDLGQTLHGQCTWDNSADNPYQYNDPPEDVQYGEGTNQEMCFFLVYFSY